MKDMVKVGGVLLPATWEKARELAEEKIKPIEEARNLVHEAQQNLIATCIRQYPVGSRVCVNIAARRSPVHEVVSVNENGWMVLRNIDTGTTREMKADSWSISPSEAWYEVYNKPTEGEVAL